VTTFDTHDSAGRVTQMTLPGSRVVGFSYDANGNLASLTPPGQPAHVFLYTEVDQEKEYQPPTLAGVSDPRTIYSYNIDRQLEQVTRPGPSVINPDYEPTTGRLDKITISEGIYDFVYEAITQGHGGRLQGISAPSSPAPETLSFGYDGPLETSVTWGGPVSGALARTLDNDFRLATESVNGASTVIYGYDGDSLPTSATVGSTTFTITRDGVPNLGAGLVTRTELGTVTTTQTPNAFGELTGDSAVVGSTPVYSNSYPQRDSLGRILQKVESVQAGASVTYDYTYTAAGQLDLVKVGGAIVRDYDYDANGNRTSVNGQLLGSYDAQDRLTSYGNTTYTYTPAGDLETKTQGAQVTAYSYDALGNLRHVTLPGGQSVDYVIDGQNRRVGKKIAGALQQGLLYSDQLRVVAEVDGSNQVVSRFVYGTKPNVPDFMVKGGVTYRILSDHLGSPRLVIDTATGIIRERIDYDEWGDVTLRQEFDAIGALLPASTPPFQPFGYAGGLYDTDTGLVRFGARDYDARVGRWTTKDPIRFAGNDTSLFGYVLGDPVNAQDPRGLEGLDALDRALAGMRVLLAGLTADVLVNIDYSINPENGNLVITVPPASMWERGFPLPLFLGFRVECRPRRFPFVSRKIDIPILGKSDVLVDPVFSSFLQQMTGASLDQTSGEF
jgi:RHS repeat-associated protein